MNVTVIETQTEQGAEWGVSFAGYDPEPSEYFKMTNKETAFRLKEKIESAPKES